MTTTPTSLDVYIVERIIRALEVVTEMNIDMVRLKDAAERYDKVLGVDKDSLPFQFNALQNKMEHLLVEFQQLHEALKEKDKTEQVDIQGRWSTRAVMITSATAFLTALLSMLAQWLKG